MTTYPAYSATTTIITPDKSKAKKVSQPNTNAVNKKDKEPVEVEEKKKEDERVVVAEKNSEEVINNRIIASKLALDNTEKAEKVEAIKEEKPKVLKTAEGIKKLKKSFADTTFTYGYFPQKKTLPLIKDIAVPVTPIQSEPKPKPKLPKPKDLMVIKPKSITPTNPLEIETEEKKPKKVSDDTSTPDLNNPNTLNASDQTDPKKVTLNAPDPKTPIDPNKPIDPKTPVDPATNLTQTVEEELPLTESKKLLTKNKQLQSEVSDLQTQVNVLINERSGQLFLYGVLTALMSFLLGGFLSWFIFGHLRR